MADGATTTTFDWQRPDYAPVYAERSERLKRLRENPEILPALRLHYAENPADFIEGWCVTVDPRNAEIGLPVNVPFLLFPRQREFIDWLYARWRAREDGLAEKSRDMGVSWLCIAFAVWMWTFHPETVIGFGSRKTEYVDQLGDPKSLFWKARTLIAMLPKEFRPRGYVQKVHAPFMRILNPENGASIIGEAGDNIGRGARTSLYIKDEAAYFERPESIEAALSATSNVKIDVSTPNGPGNPFYIKRHAGILPVFTFAWREDPRKDEKWYEKQKRELDPVIVAQEIDINYEASINNAFLDAEPVQEAMKRGPADVEARGPVIWGLDVARFGDDTTVLVKRQGRVLHSIQRWRKMDTQWIAQEIWRQATEEKIKVDQIAVDDIGVGGGVTDRLKELARGSETRIEGINAAGRVDDGRNWNVRTKMWDDMKEWFADQPVSIPNDHGLRTELTALRYHYKNGTRILESKDDAKRRGIKSPDVADALALTFARPIIMAYRPVTFISEFRNRA
ncbi:MAG TPA: TerL protein [Gammaproteobacteria bacterium]|nr:TerL protein [Gammaproteobacteria bacterium]